MSRDLPMWNDDESDVRLEYRFQYGHVLLARCEVDSVLKKLCSVFKLGKPIVVLDEIKSEELPSENDFTLLNNDKYWHFIIAQVGSNTFIFGPHRLFLGSYGWITVSRKLRVQLACVQADFDVLYYTIFRSGKHICNAALRSKGISQIKMGAMELYLNGKLFYKVKEEKDLITEDMKKFIESDIIICIDENQKIRFKKPLSKNEYIEPDEVRHSIFLIKKDCTSIITYSRR